MQEAATIQLLMQQRKSWGMVPGQVVNKICSMYPIKWTDIGGAHASTHGHTFHLKNETGVKREVKSENKDEINDRPI